MTVHNPRYPINTQVINKITQPYGHVLRIIIKRSNGIEALVEFDSVESSVRAKAALHGADIYSGCCTLRVEYSSVSYPIEITTMIQTVSYFAGYF